LLSQFSRTFAAKEERMTVDPKLSIGNSSSGPSEFPSARAEVATAVLEKPADSEPRPAENKLQRWLHRSSVFLFVLLTAVAGVLLVILPWTPEWTDNYLLLSFPSLRTFFSTGFFRGLCSGLGLLDIWIGFWEALHYREHK
jgi:hypothetical protein